MTPPRRRPGAALLVCLAVAILAGGCAGDPSQPTAEDREPDPVEDQVAGRCSEPPERLMRIIAGRLTVDAEFERPSVVDSEDSEDLHFVAAEVVGEELDREAPIGVWAVLGDLEEAPTILSINAVSRDLSDWPDGTGSEHRLTMAADGAEASEECVQAAAD